ncbi:hypothetical protein R3W88_024695 [Solanum pinnatisectum]|uniref:RNase H type-1 domain-containing protein n=1 Tax=Solanum pinnatisectum TaxID=50273 RepID=A0AAV9M1E9_9SOLN|nr:hypothetical protein R3W88_024695 [Solanum pinnatisectum]
MAWFQEKRKSNVKIKMEEAVMILWSLWEAINNLCWNNKQNVFVATLYHAKKEMEEWRSANSGAEMAATDAKMITKWERPLLDTINYNTDASYNINIDLAGIGMVLRNHLGQFIAGKTLFLGHMDSPLLVEIIGVCEALSWLKE